VWRVVRVVCVVCVVRAVCVSGVCVVCVWFVCVCARASIKVFIYIMSFDAIQFERKVSPSIGGALI
jgi:hypothetical protein